MAHRRPRVEFEEPGIFPPPRGFTVPDAAEAVDPLQDLRTLTAEEVAGLLGVSVKSVRRWVAAGELPAARWGGRLRITLDAVRAFQAGRSVRPPDPDDIIRRRRSRRGRRFA